MFYSNLTAILYPANLFYSYRASRMHRLFTRENSKLPYRDTNLDAIELVWTFCRNKIVILCWKNRKLISENTKKVNNCEVTFVLEKNICAAANKTRIFWRKLFAADFFFIKYKIRTAVYLCVCVHIKSVQSRKIYT